MLAHWTFLHIPAILAGYFKTESALQPWILWYNKAKKGKKMDWNRVFFTADTHFGHGNILKYCSRPFLNEQEKKLLAESSDGRGTFKVSRESIALNDTTIIDNINAVVGKDDILWHLGDFCFADYGGARHYRDRIVCQNVYLIWGNHDKPYIRDLFTECYNETLQEYGDKKVLMHHYPDNHIARVRVAPIYEGVQLSDKDTLYLHGHVHGGIRRTAEFFPLYDNIPIFDVGVDGLDKTKSGGIWGRKFKPWSLQDLCDLDAQKIKC